MSVQPTTQDTPEAGAESPTTTDSILNASTGPTPQLQQTPVEPPKPPTTIKGLFQLMEERDAERASQEAQRDRDLKSLQETLNQITTLILNQAQTASIPPIASQRPIPSVETSDRPAQTSHRPYPEPTGNFQQFQSETLIPAVPLERTEQSARLHSETRHASEYPSTLFREQRKTMLTEKIVPLDNGVDPTVMQWKASVMDRLIVNSDHYPTERSRKALIWGATIGRAKKCLEPRYLSESYPYQNAEEMIQLLSTHFLTGNETELARNTFDDLVMGGKDHVYETFSEFKSRFTETAIIGEVNKSEWFHYLWNKLHPALQKAAIGFKQQWNNDFQTMVNHLTSIDIERRRHAELHPTATARLGLGNLRKPNFGSSVSKPIYKSTSSHRSFTQATGSNPQTNASYRNKTADPVENFREGSSKPAGTTASSVCYRCGKPGHFKDKCPANPEIRELVEVDLEDDSEMEDDLINYGPEQIQKGNGEA
jgi:hypothetical protein